MSHHRSVTTSNALMTKSTARSLLCTQLKAKMMTLRRNVLIRLKKISTKFIENTLGSRRRSNAQKVTRHVSKQQKNVILFCAGELGEDRARDHCHLTGKCRVAAHVSCNVSYKIPKFFPVIFHSLSGYDSHEQTNSSLDWVLSHWAHFTVLRFIFVLCITVCCMHA